MPAIIPFIPLIAAAVGVGGAAVVGNQQQKRAESNAEDANEQARRNAEAQRQAQQEATDAANARQDALQASQTKQWQENAFPTSADIANQRSAGLGSLSSERSRRYESLARSLSTRGIGPGSPYSGGQASSIEGSYLSGISNLENTLIKNQNTPRYAYPYAPTQSAPNVPTASNYMAQTVPSSSSNPLGMALGMMSGSQALTDWGTESGYVPDMYGYYG